jgi:hypothetical protein
MAADREAETGPNQSRRLVAASRQVTERSKAGVKAAVESVDRARNILQLIWLRRALRKRERPP